MSIDRLNSHFLKPVNQTPSQPKQNTSSPVTAEKTHFQSTSLNFLQIGAQTLSLSMQKSLILGDNSAFKAIEPLSSKPSESVSMDAVQPFDFDFEEVAKNVMSFVSGYIGSAKAGGASDAELKELMSQARAGVDSGFEMAREELGSIDVLSPELKEGINSSYDLIQSGLTDLDEQLFGKGEELTAPVGLSGQQVRYQELEQTSLSLTTVDGDQVEIRFSGSAGAELTQQDGQSVKQFSQSKDFSIEIEGDISKEELAAIQTLVSDISDLADNFFGGNVEEAWQQAGKLGYDDSQIAGFALQMTEVKQVQISRHYAGVAQLADSPTTQDGSPLDSVSRYLNDLRAIEQESADLISGEGLQALMDQVVESGFDFDEQLLAQQQQNFAAFNQRLLAAVEEQAV